MFSRFFAATGLAAVALASVLVTPAHATTIDVAGVDFNFANPGSADILANKAAGETYLYTNVATVGGQQIDALVSIDDVSDDLIGTDYFAKFGTTEVDALNALNPAEEDDLTPGCYSNAAYVADQIAEDYLYTYEQFVAADRLPNGRVGIYDEYQGDATDKGIHTELFACTNMFYPSTATHVQITIEFQVGGDPVTLTNLLLNVQDIDGGQNVTFVSPKPSTYYLTNGTQLEVTEDANSAQFLSVDSADDDPDYAVDIEYASTSSFRYIFGLRAGAGGGGLDIMFDPFVTAADEELAPTGATDYVPAALAFFGVAFIVAGIVSSRRFARGAARS